MNIVIGVDKPARYGDSAITPVEPLLRRLRFSATMIEAVHVIPPFVYAACGAPQAVAAGPTEGELRWKRIAANTALREVAHYLVGVSWDVPRICVLAGPTAEQLIDHADAVNAELIAVNAVDHCGHPGLLPGGVARSLLLAASQSILIARPVCPKEGFRNDPFRPLRAVFATDHSAYAERCMEKLRHFAPQGLAHLTVLSAYPRTEPDDCFHLSPVQRADSEAAVRDFLCARNTAALEKLAELQRPHGASYESRVVRGPISDAIAATMRDTDADLLILGAHGQGISERIALGTIPFHEAMASHYSILVLRA